MFAQFNVQLQGSENTPLSFSDLQYTIVEKCYLKGQNTHCKCCKYTLNRIRYTLITLYTISLQMQLWTFALCLQSLTIDGFVDGFSCVLTFPAP